MALPRIMVAPNGAHKSKSDHPKLPVTIDEIVNTAVACRDAGADGLHAHVRDAQGQHVLDAGLYCELIGECNRRIPGYYVQITTEAVGKYSSREQDAVVRRVEPKAVSVALSEMAGGGDERLARNFYHWADEAGIELQHILYSASEVSRLVQCVNGGVVPAGELQVLFVLGRYTENQQSSPVDLQPFISSMAEYELDHQIFDWAVCAFGRYETDCLLAAASSKGKARVGFENNIWNRDGKLARDNCERVVEVSNALKCLNN